MYMHTHLFMFLLIAVGFFPNKYDKFIRSNKMSTGSMPEMLNVCDSHVIFFQLNSIFLNRIVFYLSNCRFACQTVIYQSLGLSPSLGFQYLKSSSSPL